MVQRKHRRQQKTWVILAVIAALFLASGIYFGTYYRADETAHAAMQSDNAVMITEIPQGGYLFDGPGEGTAMIFYPGAKVETIAYAPLLHQIAAEGCDVFLLEMPFHMAFFAVNKADQIRQDYEETSWYMAGHSLGAAMAAQYSASHLEEYDGLILLAGYPTADLHAENFRLLSIYGSEDGHQKMLQQNPQYDPDDTTIVVLEGGNHAQFGNYGIQSGDGVASISSQEQQKQTSEAIREFLKND